VYISKKDTKREKKKAYRRREKKIGQSCLSFPGMAKKEKYISVMWKYFRMSIIQSLQIIMYSTL
jgi:hypothetical protein